MSLFTVPETLPFGVALGILMGLAVIEGIGAFLTGSPSAWLEDLLPHTDADADGALDGTLGWLHVGKVPLLVLVILFLLGFALCGYVVQMFTRGLTGGFAPAWMASIPAFLVGLTTVRAVGALIAHIVPKDETSAVSEQTLIGRAGVVTTGTARSGKAAQVRVRDALGRAHYVMVEPDIESEEYGEGTAVLLVKKSGAFYRGIRNPHPGLL
jgi:membrane protein implicated in regulation of membrane protease activity